MAPSERSWRVGLPIGGAMQSAVNPWQTANLRNFDANSSDEFHTQQSVQKLR